MAGSSPIMTTGASPVASDEVAPNVMTRIPFDPDAIRALAAVLVETGLSEIEIAEKDSRIRVVRAIAPVAVAPVAIAPAAVAPAPAVAGRGQPPRHCHQPHGRRRLSVA